MGDTFPEFTLAAVQAAPCYLDREGSIEKACALIERAAAAGADLAVFGETWVPGYASFAEWPAHPLFRQALRRFVANAVEVPSPATEKLCEAARRAGIDVVIGVAERDAVTGGTVYCTLLFIGREGTILGKHRKLKPTMYERIVWGEGDGRSLRVYERPYGKLGGLNCWEHQMVLPGYALIAQGLQVHAAAWPGWTETRQETLSAAFAMQAAAYVVMAGGLLREEDIPSELREVVRATNGHSGIFHPTGRLIAGPLCGEEGILTARANLGTVLAAKMIADHAGHYARPDVFEFRLRGRPLLPREAPSVDEVAERVWKALDSGEIRNVADLRDALREAFGTAWGAGGSPRA